jgi:hypothetical protein
MPFRNHAALQALPVIANAQIEPLSNPAAACEPQAPGLLRRLQAVLDRVLYQRLERERRYEGFRQSAIDGLLQYQSVTQAQRFDV